jgi:hypothetical protein
VAIVVLTSDRANADVATVLAEMKAAASDAKLRHFEIPVAIHLLRRFVLNEDAAAGTSSVAVGNGGGGDGSSSKGGGVSSDDDGFTVENGCLTQTNKLCRPQIRKRFEQQLQALFLRTVDDSFPPRFYILLPRGESFALNPHLLRWHSSHFKLLSIRIEDRATVHRVGGRRSCHHAPCWWQL